jgi:hypothetical protein
MLKSKILTVILGICLLPQMLQAQATAKVSGRVTDEDHAPVPNANIILRDHPGGTVTNKEGYYQITLPAGTKILLIYSCVGFETDSVEMLMKPGEEKIVNMMFRSATTELPSIEVKDQQLRTGTFSRLDPKTVTFIPTMNAGIEDLIKTLPGVSSRNELSSTYSVRGGNYDENLVFVNDFEVYRPFLIRAGQQEGLSFINPDLVSSVTFSAGGWDARYGDKLSSVLDIRYKKPTSFAASFDISLLGANAHAEGLITKKLSYLIGVRYKTNTYFFKGLPTKGDYRSRYFDVQALFNYEISRKWEVSLFGIYSDNFFNLVPETRETTFGTLAETYKIMMYFDGQEADRYRNWLAAVTLSYRPFSNLRMKLITSIFQTFERETYDISAEYWLGKLEINQENGGSGEVTEALGVGAFLDHGRNYLDGTVFNIDLRGTWEKTINQLQWGIKYQHEYFYNAMNSWEMQDSAGYSLPHPPDSAGSSTPPHDPLEISDVVKNTYTVGDNRVSAFLQNTWTFKNKKNDISLTAGVRAIYYDYNNQCLVNPRVSVAFRPHWKQEIVFRLSGGYYSQPPTFRELTDLEGNLVPDLKAQNALQVVAGSDLYFSAWGRPFKFVAEAYYKYIDHLIPYEIDNLNIRYYGTNDAFGYATGIDFRINGEFVKGAESWASFSIMKTEENINGDWIPRPTDQRINLAIFFQDYIPKFPTWKVNLTLFYGTGLPFGPPDSPKIEQTLRMPPYRRVDIGLSKQLIGERTKFSKKNPLKVFRSMWISLEIFNLFQFTNTISYMWVTDVNNRQYAVPNYLTPRTFNLKLFAAF